MQLCKYLIPLLIASGLLCTTYAASAALDVVDIEELLQESDDVGRMLLQTTGADGSYGGYGTYGGYGDVGGYGAYGQFQSVTYRTECNNETKPTTLQVFVAMLQPVAPITDNEAAQDSPSGMMTMYVDSRTGEAWVAGNLNNIQNLTTVAVNAGNVTEYGPVILPLVPSSSALMVNGTPTTMSNFTSNATLIEQIWNATYNNTQDNATTAEANTGESPESAAAEAPAVSVMGFDPPLPYLAHMAFSQKVFTNATVPLLANATVNNTQPTAGGNNAADGTNAVQENAAAASTSDASPANDVSSGTMGVEPSGWANITKMIDTLGTGNATVVTTTKWTVNGSESETNITGGNGQQNTVREAGEARAFNASDYNSTNILPLLQSGLAYAAAWTSQSGDTPTLRGQFMPLGKILGASPVVNSHFPDALHPQSNYTVTTCQQVPVVTTVNGPANNQQQERASGRSVNARNGTNNAVTTDVYGADVVGNNYTAQARQTLPGVATALANITTRPDPNLQGNYSTFAAAVDAAARFLNGSSSSGGANARRNLLQKLDSSLNATQKMELKNTGGTGGVTVFAPTDAAIDKFLSAANVTTDELLANKTLLLKLISFHVVPNEAISAADLAKPRAPRQLKTLLPYNKVGYSLDRAGNATLYGVAGSSARMVDANVKSGNVIVHGINGVLLPEVLRPVATAAGKTNNAKNGGAAAAAARGTGRRLMSALHLM